MKILETLDVQAWRHHLKCGGCQTRIEVEASDLRRVSDQREGDYAMCSCPTCNDTLTIAMNLVPRAVWVTLKE